MKKILTDYDGILIETEFAKGLGWYIAVKVLKGELKIEDVPEKVESIVENKDETIKRVSSFSGGTREEFCDRVWNFCLGDYGGSKTRKDLQEVCYKE